MLGCVRRGFGPRRPNGGCSRLASVHDLAPLARFGGLVASGLRDVTHDPEALDSAGFWAVAAEFEGRLTCARFDDVRSEPVPVPVPGQWRGPAAGDWTSSLDCATYTKGVRRIREYIAAGDVYQVNRRIRDGPRTLRGRAAPRTGPSRLDRTGRTHRGGRLAGAAARHLPPGSVSGAPKSSALKIIEELESTPRGPYCGDIGWVDADRGTAALAVGIRTFWIDHDAALGPVLRFGAGAGITWGSDPEGEWAETELKAARLLAIASGGYTASGQERTG